MTILNKLSRVNRQYNTRKQLRNLPEHLIQDIGKSEQEISKELARNSFFQLLGRLLTSPIRYFNRGL